MITDPYRPSVGKVAPKDTPFIVKRSEELPAGQRKVGPRNTRKKGEESHVDAGHGVPKLYKANCQENRIIGRSRIPNTAAKPYAQPTCSVTTRLTIPAGK
jgi:hypothetical protein